MDAQAKLEAQRRRRPRQARELYRQAWVLRRGLLGDQHPDTQASRRALAALTSAGSEGG